MNNINPFEVMKAEKRLRQQKGKQALLRRLQQIRKHKAYYDKELYHEKLDFCHADGVTAVWILKSSDKREKKRWHSKHLKPNS